VSKDGKKIVFAAEGIGSRDLYLFDRQSRQIDALTESVGLETQPSFSPDGSQIVFTRGMPEDVADQLCLMTIANRKITQLTNAAQNVSTPSFSHDGKSVLFALETKYVPKLMSSTWNESGELNRIDLATKDLTNIVPENRSSSWPIESPDGKLLTWREYPGIRIAPASEIGAHRTLVPGGKSPAFNAGGTRVAYVIGDFIPDFHVEVVSVDGGKPFSVPNTDGAMQVKFLPNGRLLVLREFWRNGGSGLPSRAVWEIGVDGSGAKEVITEAMFSDPLGRTR
jgi:dipeptidyl aminopeptidase/acylaminoacyl peptidase